MVTARPAIALEPVRGLRHQRRERRRGPEPDQEMDRDELPERASTARRRYRPAPESRCRAPIAVTMPKRSVILPVSDAAEAEAEHREGKGQRDRAAGGAELGLHHRQHNHDRPHADAADRADQHGQRKPHPGLTRVGNEGGWICWMDWRGRARRQLRRRRRIGSSTLPRYWACKCGGSSTCPGPQRRSRAARATRTGMRRRPPLAALASRSPEMSPDVDADVADVNPFLTINRAKFAE